MEPELRVQRQKMNLLTDEPFFGLPMLRLKTVFTTEIKTMDVDGVTLRINPEFVNRMTDSDIKAILCEEVMHVVNLHHTRRGGRHLLKWNIACDAVLVHLIEESGHKMPNGRAENYDWAKGISAEAAFALLPERRGGSGDDDGDGNGAGAGEVRDYPGSQDEITEEEMEVKITLRLAAMAHKAKKGTLPNWMKQFVDDICEPKVRWQDVLARFVAQHTPSGQSWARPHRSFIHSGQYFPGTLKTGTSEGVIFCDTSGSYWNFLKQAFGEINSIIEDCQPERVHVIQCDASAKDIITYEQGEELDPSAVGGGGSDFRPAFKAIQDAGINPAWAVVLSDMMIDFPAVPPEFPCIMVSNTSLPGPDWGAAHIRID